MRYEEFKIVEALTTLTPGKLTKDMNRFNNLLNNIRTGKPLYFTDGTEFIADPKEADRFQDLLDNGEFTNKVTIKGKDGKEFALGSFLKTKDYGGQAIPPGQTVANKDIPKEAAGLKPSDIGIVDRRIKAGDLHSEILAANYSVQEAGDPVKEMSKQINAGQNPTVPVKELGKGVVAAINDYAGEYLGVQALIQGVSNFPAKEKFIKWMGTQIEDLTLVFPEASNAPLADSYALIDPNSGHQINISSKGKGGGAPPSISTLEIPKAMYEKKQYKTAIDFIELVKNPNLPKPTTISQVYKVMNLCYEADPQSIPTKFHEFLPWTPEAIQEILDSRKQKTELPQYQNLFSELRTKGNALDAGKLTYVVKAAAMNAINGGIIPNFEAAVLEILGFNFIQQDAKLVRGVMSFTTQWPAKINAKVTVETKAGATDPTKGGFSFKLHF